MNFINNDSKFIKIFTTFVIEIEIIMLSLKKGDIIRFLPEYRDGEIEFDYMLLEDPDGGRVKVIPVNSGLEIPPVQVVKVEWLVK